MYTNICINTSTWVASEMYDKKYRKYFIIYKLSNTFTLDIVKLFDLYSNGKLSYFFNCLYCIACLIGQVFFIGTL